MKPAAKTAIVITCILLAIVLLYPPWISLGEFQGFHLITGSYFSRYYITPQIDYARLVIIVLAVSAISVAAYFVGTSSITHSVFTRLGYVFKPLASFFSWLEKYWIWIVIASILVKLLVFASR
jgi:hypothetical protein